MEAKLEELKARLVEAVNLQRAAALLVWDQNTYMPPGGGPARGRQIATLAGLAQEKFTDPAIGRLLDDLEPWAESQAYESDEASLVRVTRREYERAIKVPPAFLAELYGHTSDMYQAWSTARPNNDFKSLEPRLQKTLDLSRRFADFFPGYAHVADPLIDRNDYGMKASTIRALFADLREQLVPVVQAILDRPAPDDAFLHQLYPESLQLGFAQDVIRQLGYDYQRGRVDKTLHPFMIKFSLGDVRITTRVNENGLDEALFSTIHEAGHAMYEQGIRMDLEGTLLAEVPSAGAHESQSRLWENIVARSRGFWEHFYPRLQAVFPDQLGSTSLEAFYRAINKVERSLIRTSADEVTYNLHVMLRFDFELAMLEGSLPVRDLPEAWRERYRSDLGIAPPDDREGVLQDVHWFSDVIGGVFQGYTLGNILSAQFFEAANQAYPQIPEEISQGKFDTLRGWLKENVYQHGAKFTTEELVQRATGKQITIDPYVRYLKSKYGELYDL